jgi:hypothetical protein
VVGDRIKLGEAELVVRAVADQRIAEVGLELLAEEERLPAVRLWRKLQFWLRRQRFGERLRMGLRRR